MQPGLFLMVLLVPRLTLLLSSPFLLPTACLNHKTCSSCVSSQLNFDCSWCEGLNRCSDGIDRYREEFLGLSCHIDVRLVMVFNEK